MLAAVPNALSYQRVVETETNGYLVRQFLYNSLYDRISTRPFLEDVEKRWLAFQLLCGLRDCHAQDVYHGDIRTENTLVTSWNWLYLSDFSSSFKPVMLPDDNPSDFSYYFDTAGRRTCYLAPERFYAPGEEFDPDAKLTWAMDVFGAGCVIAELFIESPIFSLSQLYKYRRGEHDPTITHLGRLQDAHLQEMIAHMIQLDPQKRYSAEQTLQFWKGKVFPEYFYNFLHQYMEDMTDPSSGQYPLSGATRNLGEADDRIDRIYYDFDKISYFLGYQDGKRPPSATPSLAPRLGLRHFPVRLNIPNNEHSVVRGRQPLADNGTLIFLTLVVSSLRNTARSASKIRGCDILLAFAERLADDAKLDRVLPYVMSLLGDKVDLVVIAAVRTITQLLDLVQSVSPVNAHVFLEYVLPRMQAVLLGNTHESRSLVRATYASCLGTLAVTASRFLQVASAVKGDAFVVKADPEIEPGSNAHAGLDEVFDEARRELILLVERQTKTLVEDPDPHVRRAFLSSAAELCVFFGAADANDIIVTHLNTYLNDRDWMLKCAFFETIVGIAVFLGSVTLEAFMLPLMVQALTDPEEHVVQAALHSLAELARLGMFSQPMLLELTELVIRFTMHPNIWIREAATRFLASGAQCLSPAKQLCLLLPVMSPYLKRSPITDFAEIALLDDLKSPISRPVFDQALHWALKSDRGVFWKSISKLRGMAFGSSPGATSQGGELKSLSKVARNEEDEQWLGRLRNLGLSKEDEFKLLALREFLWRLGQIKKRDAAAQEDNHQLNNVIPLRSLGITPQTVLFDEEWPKRPSDDADMGNIPRSIEDALQDASMTIDDPLSKRRRAALNTHRSRVGRTEASPITIEGRRERNDEAMASLTSTKIGLGSSPASAGGLSRRSSLGPGKGSSSVGTNEGASADETSSSLPRRSLRHQPSAMSLLNRKDSVKSGPETGTTEANAFGRVEGRSSTGQALLRSPLSSESPTSHGGETARSSHTYSGNDPSVLKMLDAMFTENYPHDVLEFGPLVTPIARRKASKVGAAGVQEAWRPTGNVVATFSEHTGAIHRVVASPDHVFFITGGEDGTVRVWDTLRLERNITHRSRQVHRHASGAKVVALCFIENTHSFVSCAGDGSVHVVKVEVVHVSGGAPRYNKLRPLREYQLPEGEWAVWCEHFKHEASSVLVLATNRSRVLGIDLRTMSLLYALENPVHHGTPTCFAVDRKHNWLVLGTSHGVLDLWDLRFKMRLKGWGVPGKSTIYRLAVHPSKGRGKWLCVAGGTGQGEVTAWDLEKTLCREIYRVGGNKEGPKGYEPWEVDEDRPESMLGRFANNIESAAAPGSGNTDKGVRAMAVGSSAVDEQRDIRHSFVVTGGSDKKLRFWDLARIENSSVFSGLGPDEGKPTFHASHVTTAMTLNTERLARPATTAAGSGSGGGHGGAKGRSGGGGGGARPPRSTVISLQQQQLLRSHLDFIQDVALLESPYNMTVSVDRIGVVYVFS